MLEFIVMTQLYFTDGTYEFRNYNLIGDASMTESMLCNDRLKENALKLSSVLTENKATLSSRKAICTDFVKTLDFYPVPFWVPVHQKRPKEDFI